MNSDWKIETNQHRGQKMSKDSPFKDKNGIQIKEGDIVVNLTYYNISQIVFQENSWISIDYPNRINGGIFDGNRYKYVIIDHKEIKR